MSVFGKDKVATQIQVIEELKKSGLGELKIKDIASQPQIKFKAIAFEDGHGEIGMSYSGTDFAAIARDEDSNLPEHLKEVPEQIEAGKRFFEKNKQEEKTSYLYGHSMGGNIASHVYLENNDLIESAHVINALPVSPELLEAEKDVKAFCDMTRYYCDYTGGDCAAQLKDFGIYLNNVMWIKCDDRLKNNFLGNHLLEGITFDHEDSLKYTYKAEANIEKKSIIKKEDDNHKKEQIEEEKIEEFMRTFFHKTSIAFDKAIEFGKDIWGKLKVFGSRLFKDNVKLLTDGVEHSKPKEELDFKNRQQLDAYIKDGVYSAEQAMKAQQVSDNPIKFMEENEKSNIQQEKNDKNKAIEDNIL